MAYLFILAVEFCRDTNFKNNTLQLLPLRCCQERRKEMKRSFLLGGQDLKFDGKWA